MKHFMRLQSRPFDDIKNGRKTVELRLWDEKRSLISVGDEIEFTDCNGSQKLTVSVTALHRFDSFEELYQAIPLKMCGYRDGETADPKDMEEYYPRGKQKLYGVVGIEIHLVSRP